MSKKLDKVMEFCKKHEKAVMVTVGVGAGLVLGVTAVKLYGRIKPKKLVSGKFEWGDVSVDVKDTLDLDVCSIVELTDGSFMAYGLCPSVMGEFGDRLVDMIENCTPETDIQVSFIVGKNKKKRSVS